MKTKSQEKTLRSKNMDVISPARRTTSTGYMPKRENKDKLVQTSNETMKGGKKKMGFYENAKGETYAKQIKK